MTHVSEIPHQEVQQRLITTGTVEGIRLAAVELACKQVRHSNVMESNTDVAGQVAICHILSVEMTAAVMTSRIATKTQPATTKRSQRRILGPMTGGKPKKLSNTSGFENTHQMPENATANAHKNECT